MSTAYSFPETPPAQFGSHICSDCNVGELCLAAGLGSAELHRLDQLVSRHRLLKRSSALYRAGMPLHSLYALRSGFLKSSVLHDDGREQVAAFHMAGELIGMDGIGSGTHMCDVIALENSEVCEIPFTELETLSREIPALQQHFHRLLSREIVRDYGVMLLLGSMRAEERLAAFLLNLSMRFAARGYSPHRFYLRMTREEIGSYLGLKFETVSRTFSRFQEDGLITVQNKYIEIVDSDRLKMVVGQNRATH